MNKSTNQTHTESPALKNPLSSHEQKKLIDFFSILLEIDLEGTKEDEEFN